MPNVSRLIPITLALLCIHPSIGSADVIYTCREERVTSIGWEKGGFFNKEGLRAEAENKSGSAVITLIAGEQRGAVKGNLGQSELIRVNSRVFLEETGAGNLVFWTILAETGKVPTYVFQQKAYDLNGPYSVTVAWKCQ